jgi:uncharacterized membrane protein YbhN (UPF0104 family)
VLALRHMRKTLPIGRVALASFTSYAFTHSFGFGSLMHATIRYRLYAPLGLRTVDIAEITAFVNITFMIGLAVMFPVIALLHASALAGIGLPEATAIAFGAAALALAVAYAALGWWVQRLELFGYVLKVPAPITTFAQIGLSLADLTLAGAVFYMCLPDPARGRDIVPDTRGRTRRFTTLFIRIAGGELQLCGVIRSAASRCW